MAQVAVLAGGPSSEHDVSLDSSRNLLALLRAGGHRASPVHVGRDLSWAVGGPDDDLQVVIGRPAEAHLSTDDALAELRRREAVACLGLHGPWGEDGTVQRLLEKAGVVYTGSGPVPSSQAFDKELAKLAATRVGAHCPAHEVLQGERLPVWGIGRGLGYPCFVKPVRAGSSVGVTRVEREEQLEAASRAARAADEGDRCMVEELVPGTEVTCAVLRKDGTLLTLPLVAIEVDHGFYDYHAKYASETTRLICPAEVPDAVRSEIEQVSRDLYRALELRGVVRLDFIVSERDGLPRFLEVNTLPGFTAHSLVPLAARTAGLSPLAVVEAVLSDVDGRP